MRYSTDFIPFIVLLKYFIIFSIARELVVTRVKYPAFLNFTLVLIPNKYLIAINIIESNFCVISKA
jgi:hypothetical protein